jgi:serine/threonine protein kinase
LQGQIVTSKQLEINPSWCAPEALSCDTRVHYGTYSDVYSFGICLWELLTWRLPWEAPYAYCGDAYCPQPHYHQLHITNAVRAGEERGQHNDTKSAQQRLDLNRIHRCILPMLLLLLLQASAPSCPLSCKILPSCQACAS